MITHENLVEAVYRWERCVIHDYAHKCERTCKECSELVITEYEYEVVRKFAEWLINRMHRNSLQRVLSETKNFDIMGIDNILSIYEKEQKGEQT